MHCLGKRLCIDVRANAHGTWRPAKPGPIALPIRQRCARCAPLCPAVQPSEKRARVDPKEAAKQKAAEARQAAKAAKLAKEASGMRKLSAFFTPRPK